MDCDKIKATGLTFTCCWRCHQDSIGPLIDLNGTTLHVCCAAARAVEGEPTHQQLRQDQEA